MSVLKWMERCRRPACILALIAVWATVITGSAYSVASRSSDQVNSRLNIIGQVGGAMSAVLRLGDLAYVAIGSHVSCFDLGDPNRLRLMNRGPLLPDQVVDLAMGDGFALALLRRQGLAVLDLARPCDPRLIGLSSPWPEGDSAGTVAVAGRLAIVSKVAGAEIWAIDLADLRHPVLRGVMRSEQYPCNDVVLIGQDAICGRSDGSYLVFDVSRAAQPRLKEAKALPEAPRAFLAQGAYLYVGGPSSLMVLDWRRSSAERVVHFESLPGWGPLALHADGDRLYAADDDVLAAFSLADPASPRPLSDLRLSPPASNAGEPIGLAAEADQVILVDAWMGMRLYDRDDTQRLRLLARWSELPFASAVALGSTDRAVVMAWQRNHASTQVWDLLSPNALRLDAQSVPVVTGSNPGKLSLAGRLACSALSSEGIQLFDTGVPGTVKSLARLDSPGIARQCLVLGTWGFVADDPFLTVVDVSSPSQPRARLRLEGFPSLQGMAAAGTFLYLAQDLGLTILDVRNPLDPSLLGELSLGVSVQDVAVAGGLAHIVARDGRLFVVDVGNPSSPRVVGQVAFSGGASAVAAEGDRVVVAAAGALNLVDVSRPDRPRILQQVPVPFMAAQLHLKNGLLTVAEGSAGLGLYRLGAPIPTATFVPPATRRPTASPTPNRPATTRPPLPFRGYLPRLPRWR